MKPMAFSEPIYVTRPVLPSLERVSDNLKKIWESRWFSNGGQFHQKLEKDLQLYLKVPTVNLFNNGTIALMVAAKALNLKGEVITTPFTFPATPHSLTWNGLTPVFVDIEKESLNIDPTQIEERITENTTAILGVHVFGNPCNVGAIQSIADKYGLKVIYDAAHAFGVEISGRGISEFGDLTMFSFHPTKLYHTSEGGALASRHSELYSRINLLKNFGILDEDNVVDAGINGKMNEIQAAIGLEMLNEIENEKVERRRIKTIYKQRLSEIEGIEMISPTFQSESSEQYFVIRIKPSFGLSRNEVYAELKKFNIFARKYFYPLCSEYPHYKSSNVFQNAESAVQEVLSLPFYGALTTEMVNQICDVLGYLKAKGK